MSSASIADRKIALARTVTLKVWQCGDVIMRRDYIDGVKVPPAASGGRVRGQAGTRTDSAASRSKMTVQLLLMANEAAIAATGWFWTGTFAADVTDYGDASAAWSRFARRLRRRWPGVCYVCVPEIQEKRAERYGVRVWHFHAVIWAVDVGYAREFGAMWCAVNGDVHNRDKAEPVRYAERVSSYIRKYVTKSTLLEVPPSRKSFFSGGPMARPVVESWRADSGCPPPPPVDASVRSWHSYVAAYSGRITTMVYEL